MRKTLYSKFDKKEISALPQVTFSGRIISIISAQETEKAVDYLLSCDILGVDTETKPAFHRHESHKVCLLQVSTRDTCFLFRLNHTGMTPAVKRLLEDTTVKKVGLSWHDDLRALQGLGEFTPGWFVDLQDMVGEIGVKDLSLQKLYANVFQQKISKRQRLSNWEAPVLTDKQKQYAAIDAWSCIQLYEEMVRLRDTHDYDLIVVPEPEPLTPPKTEEEKAAAAAKRAARKKAFAERKAAEAAAGKTTAAKPRSRQTRKRRSPAKPASAPASSPTPQPTIEQ